MLSKRGRDASKPDWICCLRAELVCRVNTFVEFCCLLKAPTTVISSHSMVPPLSKSKSCEISGSSQQKQLPCLFHCIPSLHPSLPHLFYTEMFASKASLLKNLLFLLSLTLIWALSIQLKVRQEGIAVPGTNIDKCYCSSMSLMIYIHMGGSITHRAQRHGCQHEFISGEKARQVI